MRPSVLNCKRMKCRHDRISVCAGDGGFFIISANATQIQYDYFVLGSLFSQCTITSFADKTRQPIASPNCALGQPNSCCAAGKSSCY